MRCKVNETKAGDNLEWVLQEDSAESTYKIRKCLKVIPLLYVLQKNDNDDKYFLVH